ncbi:hypothetical protein [Mucilaginibacter ginsenosidivorans]|uniref:Uncharacterized protein n=1 Tax=Mucilaginibacter ginsenosidivorans TaxID=398053 RepID=A0A5B8UWS5_9SPHI|nr:hypothetical protein [Mucilaginibacter ginsenosidivorans]QEC62771.1 hypothetical protein FRZ54_09300 [Mucilaginibacter ginsenosidivorans]
MAFLYLTSLPQLKPTRELLTPLPGFCGCFISNYLPHGAFFAGSAPVGAVTGISILNRMLINVVENHAFFNYFYYNSR